MADIKDIFQSKKLPAWFTGHSIFKTHKKIEKIFPHIGLANCEEEIALDNSHEVSAAAKNLLVELNNVISARQTKLAKFTKKKESSEAKQMRAARKKLSDNCQSLLNDLKSSMHKNPAKFITTNNGKITLNLAEDIKNADDEVIFKPGEGLFRVYNKINELLKEGKFVELKKIDTLATFKEFSSKNVPSIKYKIVFSSDGEAGLWDIATMSMRGISSCQSWAPGTPPAGNAAHIVGSMIDPFTGIVYITSGEKYNEYGSKMIRRCVVRFIINEKTREPSIYLERMYPGADKSTQDTFINFLKKKTDNKYPVVYGPEATTTNYYVPMSSAIKNLNPSEQPYKDSGMVYKTDSFDIYGAVKEKAEKILSKIYCSVGSKVINTARGIKMSTIPESSKKGFRAIRGTSYYEDASYLIYEDLLVMAKAFFAQQDITKHKDPSEFLSGALDDFSKGLPDMIYETLKESCTKRKISQIEEPVLKTVASGAATQISEVITDELKKIDKNNLKVEIPKEIPVYVKLLN